MTWRVGIVAARLNDEPPADLEGLPLEKGEPYTVYVRALCDSIQGGDRVVLTMAGLQHNAGGQHIERPPACFVLHAAMARLLAASLVTHADVVERESNYVRQLGLQRMAQVKR